MMDWMFKKRDAEIERLKKKIEDLKEENTSLYSDIRILVNTNDKSTEYHKIVQKWRMIIDFENTIWYGDAETVVAYEGILKAIMDREKK